MCRPLCIQNATPQATGGSGQQSPLIDAGLGADGGPVNAGMVAAGIALLIAAGGVVGWALLRRRNSHPSVCPAVDAPRYLGQLP